MNLKKATFTVTVIFNQEESSSSCIVKDVLTDSPEKYIGWAIENGFRKEEISAFVLSVKHEETVKTSLIDEKGKEE